MRRFVRNTLTAALIASTALNVPPVLAAKILFAVATDKIGHLISAGNLPPAQEISTNGGTVQIELDDGSHVSIVGPARFSIGTNGQLTVLAGSVTIVPAEGPIAINLPGGAATLGGAGGFNVGPNGVTGFPMGGPVSLTLAGTTRAFAIGEAFGTSPGGTPIALFRARAQAVPPVHPTPASLPSGLAQNPSFPGLPKGGINAIHTYLLGLVGDDSLPGNYPALILGLTTPQPTPTPTPAPTPTPTPTPTPSPPTTGIGNSVTVSAPTAVSGLYNGGPGDPGTPNVTTDASGRPTALGFYGSPGTAILTQFASGNGWILGRYGSGTFIAGGSSGTLTFDPNDAAHFVSQAPTTALPTSGTAQYTVTTATEPTFPGGARSFDDPVTVINLGVSFGSAPKFGFDGIISGQVNGTAPASVSFSTSGGSANPALTNVVASNGNLSLFGTAPLTAVTANLCTSTAACKMNANFISGAAAAATFGVGWGLVQVSDNISILNGAAILTKVSTTTTPPASANPLPAKVTLLGNGPKGNNVFQTDNVTVVANADGAIDSYAAGTLVASRGTAQAVDFGTATTSTSVIAWTRWANGTPTGTPNGMTPVALSANQGVVTLVGTNFTNRPTTGSAQYTLLGATKPVISDGLLAPGTFSGALSVDFATSRVGVDLLVAIGGVSYALQSTGSTASPSQSAIGYSAAGQINGVVTVAPTGICSKGCGANINGSLFGSGALQAGITYNISPGTGLSIFGVAAFGKQ